MLNTVSTTAIAKHHFKCFLCKNVTPNQKGDWIDWNGMQVHLCLPCDKSSVNHNERNPAAAEV